MKNKIRLRAATRQTGSFKAEGNELMLYGVIGDYFDDMSAQKIIGHIQSMKGDITIKVNSPGGDVFDGIAIMNALKAYKGKKIFKVEALAASIASVIAVGAADEIIMSEGAFMMIHNPWTFAAGDSAELKKTANVLDQITESLNGIYSRKTGKSVEEITEMMNAETWMSAKDAVEMGFADSTDETEPESVSNFDLSVFNNVPEALRLSAVATKPKSIRELENVLHKAGFSRSEARAVASNGMGNLQQRDVAEDLDSEKLLAAINSRKY